MGRPPDKAQPRPKSGCSEVSVGFRAQCSRHGFVEIPRAIRMWKGHLRFQSFRGFRSLGLTGSGVVSYGILWYIKFHRFWGLGVQV